jgi:hypothetical protein
MEEFEIIADVEEFRLEDMMEQVQYVNQLQQTIGKSLTTKAFGEMLDMPDLDSMIEPNSQPPAPVGQSNFQVTDQGTQRRFGVSGKNG